MKTWRAWSKISWGATKASANPMVLLLCRWGSRWFAAVMILGDSGRMQKGRWLGWDDVVTVVDYEALFWSFNCCCLKLLEKGDLWVYAFVERVTYTTWNWIEVWSRLYGFYGLCGGRKELTGGFDNGDWEWHFRGLYGFCESVWWEGGESSPLHKNDDSDWLFSDKLQVIDTCTLFFLISNLLLISCCLLSWFYYELRVYGVVFLLSPFFCGHGTIIGHGLMANEWGFRCWPDR